MEKQYKSLQRNSCSLQKGISQTTNAILEIICLKSCLIQVPGTFNSKCLAKINDSHLSSVSVVSEWNRNRADVRVLPFKRYVEKLERYERKMLQNRHKYYQSNTVPHIEKLLYMLKQSRGALKDYRERIFSLILCPYLINIKKQSFEETEKTTLECFGNHLPMQKIRYKMKNVLHTGVLPHRLDKMRQDDYELYDVVTKIVKLKTTLQYANSNHHV